MRFSISTFYPGVFLLSLFIIAIDGRYDSSLEDTFDRLTREARFKFGKRRWRGVAGMANDYRKRSTMSELGMAGYHPRFRRAVTSEQDEENTLSKLLPIDSASPQEMSKRRSFAFGKKSDESMEEMQKRRSFAFGKREHDSPNELDMDKRRSFAFGKRDPDFEDEDMEKRRSFAFGKRDPELYDQDMDKRRAFAFGKRRSFAFGKRFDDQEDLNDYEKRRAFAFGKRRSFAFGKREPEMDDSFEEEKRRSFAFGKRIPEEYELDAASHYVPEQEAKRPFGPLLKEERDYNQNPDSIEDEKRRAFAFGKRRAFAFGKRD